MSLLVLGEIELPQDTASFSGATLYVTLESIGMMDMPSTVLAQNITTNLRYDGSNIAFELDTTNIPDNVDSLNIRAHISMQGVDDVQKGDFVSKRSYRVQKENPVQPLSVTVEPV